MSQLARLTRDGSRAPILDDDDLDDHREPLLFRRDDFTHNDITPAR